MHSHEPLLSQQSPKCCVYTLVHPASSIFLSITCRQVWQWTSVKSNGEPFSEQSRFFLQVILAPLWQALEVIASRAQQALECHIRQVGLESEPRGEQWGWPLLSTLCYYIKTRDTVMDPWTEMWRRVHTLCREGDKKTQRHSASLWLFCVSV